MKIKQKILKSVSLVLIIATVLSLGFIVFMSLFAEKNIDYGYDEKLFSLSKEGSYTEYYVDKSGKALSLAEYSPDLLCSISLGEAKKSYIPLSEISPNVINAFLSSEDREFYKHKGVNYRRTLEAFINSIFHFRASFGASTITQQVVKNISGDNEITFKRKLSEMIRAGNIERNHTKEEILELYLNIIPMGENLYGINTASLVYFGKTPDSITVGEAATLAAITNAPTRYNPHMNREACLKKRNTVLFAMWDNGVLTEEEYLFEKSQPLEVLPKTGNTVERYSWFVEAVNKDVVRDLMEKYNISEAAAISMLTSGGLKIYTTEKKEVQDAMEAYFYNLKNFPYEVSLGLDYAMVVIDSKSGNLVGTIGAVGEKNGNLMLDLAATPRTPGSVLKPLALYTPLIDDKKITYSTVFDDVPVHFGEASSGLVGYPQNYPRVYDGLTTVKDALRRSKNTVAVRLYDMLGAEKIYKNLKENYGFKSLVRRDYKSDGSLITDLAPSPLALGQLSRGVTLTELTQAYTAFPAEGVLNKTRSYVAVLDSDGEVILENREKGKRIFSETSARIMNQMLMNVTANGTASQITLKNSVDTAGKTGTSGDDKDRLFVGYTPYYTAGIWCGYREGNKSVGYLSPTHLKIWDDVMSQIHSDILSAASDSSLESFSTKGLVRREFCRDSGKLISDACTCDPRGSRVDFGYFTPETAPHELCDRHVFVWYDKDAGGIATELCPSESLERISLILVENRAFPKEITVTDAEYTVRRTDGAKPYPHDYELPYFYYYLPEGEYAGKSKNKKQFNSFCYIHDE